MKNYLVVTGGVILAVVMALWAVNVRTAQAPGPVACTTEAKICLDGSSVGRSGPNCEFEQCPTVATTTASVGTKSNGLAIGSSVTIQGTTIKVIGPVEDSRCPNGVQCVWAGTVGVHVSINSSSKDTNLILNQPQTVGNAVITLVGVTPGTRSSTQTIAQSDYRLTFTVVPNVGVVTPPRGGQVVCTMDAKLCPDGSYVGRTGPNCVFAPCPTSNSGVQGNVLLGPTCPVQRMPPDPQCADRPYATAITVYRAGSTSAFIIGNSDASGAFQFSLPPGSYTLTATGGTMLPRCSSVDVTVSLNAYTTTTISCDMGIR